MTLVRERPIYRVNGFLYQRSAYTDGSWWRTDKLENPREWRLVPASKVPAVARLADRLQSATGSAE